jgi:hypothetical protein
MADRRPSPVLAMTPRLRADGSRYLAVRLTRPLELPAGTELHLRRIGRDDEDGPTHALQVVLPPPESEDGWLPRRESADAGVERLDGAAIRLDPRDLNGSPMP